MKYSPTKTIPWEVVKAGLPYSPMPGKVIVERAKVQKEINGIALAPAAYERPTEGVVLAVGDGLANKKGKVIPMSVREGDKVYFTRHAGNKLPDGEDLWIMQESFILGVIE